MSLSEFEVIDRYFRRAVADPDVVLGIGDDAAVVDTSGRVIVTVDTLVAGVHVPQDAAGGVLGHRVLAVNLSDMAAMGSEPRWCTLALTLPAVDETWLAGFANGLFELAGRFGVTLIGGDLTQGPLSATVQLIGEPGARLLTRSGGVVGDDVYVTGSLGDSAGWLALLDDAANAGDPAYAAARAAVEQRFYRPSPRVAEGLALASLASAAIDVSDGLLADLGHLCAASQCGALLDVDRVPLSAELSSLFSPEAALAHALGGGDDYELCFTASASQAGRIEDAMAACGTAVRRIGRLVPGREVSCRRGGEPFAPPTHGYLHFR